MSAVSPIDYYSIRIGNLTGPFTPFRLPESTPEATLHIIIPGFEFSLLIPLEELTNYVEPNKVNVRFAVDAGLTLTVDLTGNPVESGMMFEPKAGSLYFQLTDEKNPRAQFVGTTLMAMLGIAKEVPLRVPEIELNVGMHFNIPLRDISGMLITRQLTHALMVIEKATGKSFQVIPTSLFSKDERDSIAFTYHAIVDRSFKWSLSHPVGATIPVTEEVIDRFPTDGQPFKYLSPLGQVSQNVLGQSILLGEGEIFIADAVFHDLETARREISQNKGGMATVGVESLSGYANFEFPEAPQLPSNPWDWKLQALIDLEPQLDTHLAAAYHALAASTLANLTEEEKERVIARPTLDEDADLIKD